MHFLDLKLSLLHPTDSGLPNLLANYKQVNLCFFSFKLVSHIMAEGGDNQDYHEGPLTLHIMVFAASAVLKLYSLLLI